MKQILFRMWKIELINKVDILMNKFNKQKLLKWLISTFVLIQLLNKTYIKEISGP